MWSSLNTRHGVLFALLAIYGPKKKSGWPKFNTGKKCIGWQDTEESAKEISTFYYIFGVFKNISVI